MVLFHRIKKIFLLLFLVISLFNSCNYFFKQESIFLDGEWEYYWDQRKSKDSPPISLKDDKWKVYKIGTEPDNRTENENNILWIRKKIPEINLNSPNLLIRNPIPCLEIFIEDKSILEIGSINSEKKLEYNKDFFPIIPLKENFSDKYIYLKMYSQSNFLLGLYETPSVGPYKVLLSEFIQKNQSYSSMGFLFVFIGLCCIYFYIIRKQNILISFAVMSLSTGVIYGILSGFFGALWFEDAPLVLKTYCISTLVTPIGFIGLFYNIFGNGKKHINFILLVAYTVYIIIFIPLLFLEIIPVQKAIFIASFFYLPILIYQIIISWLQTEDNHKYAIYYAIGITVFTITIFIDLLSVLGYLPFDNRVAPQGFLVMIACFTILLEKKIRLSEKEIAEFEKEIKIAAKIQKSIIPQKTPDFVKLQFESYYRPMQKVGGDFFDYVEISDGVYGFLIADVSGHGVGASIIAAMSRIAFSNLHAFANDPPNLLKKMNQSFLENYTGQFITAGYLVVDTKKKKLFYSSAGHDPIFVIKESGESYKLKPKGKPLGITPNLELDMEELKIEKGMRIMMYTDGLTDMSSESWDSYGDDTIFFTLCSSYFPRMSIVDLKDKFIRDILEIQGIFPEGIQDDITFLIIEIGKI